MCAGSNRAEGAVEYGLISAKSPGVGSAVRRECPLLTRRGRPLPPAQGHTTNPQTLPDAARAAVLASSSGELLTGFASGRRDSNPRLSPWQGDAQFRSRPLQPLESTSGTRVHRWSPVESLGPLRWSSRWSSRAGCFGAASTMTCVAGSTLRLQISGRDVQPAGVLPDGTSRLTVPPAVPPSTRVGFTSCGGPVHADACNAHRLERPRPRDYRHLAFVAELGVLDAPLPRGGYCGLCDMRRLGRCGHARGTIKRRVGSWGCGPHAAVTVPPVVG
jgi:hypothetical protein